MVNPTAAENITAIKEARKLFDDVRGNLSNNEKKVIRRKLYKKKAASHFFNEKENDGTLTDRQRNVLKNIARYTKNISKHRKSLSKHQKKSEKYGHDIDHFIVKKTITILMLFKRIESFLMNVEVIFHIKKEMKSEKKLYKKEAVYNFLKDKEQNGSLTNE